MQDELKAQTMYDFVEQWQQSGTSQKQFCERNGIKLSTLGYWVKRYKQSGSGHEGFASLSLGPGPDTQNRLPKVEVELPGGLVVRVY